MRPEILTVPLPLILPTIVMLELIEETPRSRLASLVTAAQVKVLGCASVGLTLAFPNMSCSFLPGIETGSTDDAWERHGLFRCGAFIAARSLSSVDQYSETPPEHLASTVAEAM